MNDYFFGICVTICTVVFIISITWIVTNGGNNYHRAFELCLAAEHTWIPTHNAGVCLAPTMTVRNGQL